MLPGLEDAEQAKADRAAETDDGSAQMARHVDAIARTNLR